MGKKLFNDREKWCPGCKAWLPLSDFHNCKTQTSGKKSRCKKCWKKQNAPHVRKYLNGMSDSELLVLWEKQHKCCAICQKPIPFLGRRLSHIDRDPATREVRGLLCSKCNWGMGSFKDNQAILTAAVEYLKRFEMERRDRRRRGIKPICSSHA
jgi:predicted amidophosphoribosyltransferase